MGAQLEGANDDDDGIDRVAEEVDLEAKDDELVPRHVKKEASTRGAEDREAEAGRVLVDVRGAGRVLVDVLVDVLGDSTRGAEEHAENIVDLAEVDHVGAQLEGANGDAHGVDHVAEEVELEAKDDELVPRHAKKEARSGVPKIVKPKAEIFTSFATATLGCVAAQKHMTMPGS